MKPNWFVLAILVLATSWTIQARQREKSVPDEAQSTQDIIESMEKNKGFNFPSWRVGRMFTSGQAQVISELAFVA